MWYDECTLLQDTCNVKIGELYVEFKIKGKDDAAKTLKNTRDGLKGAKSDGIAFKAALLGIAAAFYKLKQWSGKSLDFGQSLQTFKNLTLGNIQGLQKWQQAFIGVGVSADSVTKSVTSLQGKVVEMLTGDDPGKLRRVLGNTVGFDPEKGVEDPLYTLSKLHDYAGYLKKNPAQRAVGVSLLKELLPEDQVAGLFDPRFNGFLRNTDKRRTISDSEQKSLADTKSQLAIVEDTLQKSIDHLVAALGPEVIASFKYLADALLNFSLSISSFLNNGKTLDSFNNTLSKGGEKGLDFINEYVTPLIQDFMKSRLIQGNAGAVPIEVINNLTITGDADPKAIGSSIGEAVQKALDTHINKTYRQGQPVGD